MATEPVEDEQARLREERDALEARALEAERRAEALEAELERTRAELGADQGLSLFDDIEPDPSPPPPAHDTPEVTPIALGATAVVAAMVGVLTAFDQGLGSPVALVMFLITALLVYLAWQRRGERFKVSVTRGMVYADSGRSSYRFDLRSTSTRVEMPVEPGRPDWQVRFHRGKLDPFVVDATMVDQFEFTRQLREWRSDL